MRSDAQAVRRALCHVPTLCNALGVVARRDGSGFKILCPWHEEKTPSCSVFVARDGTLALHCFGCEQSGDALSLVAAARGLDPKTDFREVLLAAAEIGGCRAIVEKLSLRAPARMPTRAVGERTLPLANEITELWEASRSVCSDAAACAMLEARCILAERVDDLGLARVIPSGITLPRFARFHGRSWLDTDHRLLVQLRDSRGVFRSLRARRIGGGDTPKCLPPAGHRMSGLVVADPFAAGLLRLGRHVDGMPETLRIVVTEGESDYLSWATRFSDADATAPLVIGIVSGSWSKEFASRIPVGAHVLIRTDHDAAGDKYAEQIRASLVGRCHVRRSRPRQLRRAA